MVWSPFASSPTSSASTTAGKYVIGVLPVASFDSAAALLPRVTEIATHGLALRDEGRAVSTLCPSPRGALVAAVDGLGRVLLVDGANVTIIRIWKVTMIVLTYIQCPHLHATDGFGEAPCMDSLMPLVSPHIRTFTACNSTYRGTETLSVDGWMFRLTS